MDVVSINIKRPLDLGPAERATLAHLSVGTRVVITTEHAGQRQLALHVIPLSSSYLSVRGGNAMVAQSKYAAEVVGPAFREARKVFDGFEGGR